MLRLALVTGVAACALVVAVPAILGKARELRDRVTSVVEGRSHRSGQRSSQISGVEFAALRPGLSPRELERRVGKPESRARADVETRKIECWYYGVAEGTGAYQLCFADGRLVSKARY